jgi:hypothetical protein
MEKEKQTDVFEKEMLNEFMKARHMPKQAIQQQLMQKQSMYGGGQRSGFPEDFNYNDLYRVQQQIYDEEIQVTRYWNDTYHKELQRQLGIEAEQKMEELQQFEHNEFQVFIHGSYH